jgi:hypothetical protein
MERSNRTARNRIAGFVAIAWIATASTGYAQNCVISGGANYGNIEQHCIISPPRLAFDPAIARDLIGRLAPGKKVDLKTIGSASDQTVASQYQEAIQRAGFQIDRTTIGMMAPPPDHPITVIDGSAVVTVLIAPSAH